MKTYLRKNVKVISELDGDVFEEKLNKFLNALGDSRIDFDLKFNDNLGLCAYVIYTVEESVPECITDYASMMGIEKKCFECVKFHAPADGRKKYCECADGKHTHAGATCCDDFYMRHYPVKEVCKVVF